MNLIKSAAAFAIVLVLISTAVASNEYKEDFENPTDLPPEVASNIVNVDGDRKLRIENEKISLMLPEPVEGWESISYKKSGSNVGNTVTWIFGEGENKNKHSFREYMGVRPVIRFVSNQQNHRGYKRYPTTDFDVEADTEYKVVINRTGPWSADVRLFRNNREILSRAGTRIEDLRMFGVFENIRGGFTPYKFAFKSNKPGEVGLFDDLIIKDDGSNSFDEAPPSSLLIAHPSWKPALMASVVDQPLVVREEVDAYVRERIEAEDPDRIYAVGDVDTAGINATSIEPSDIPQVFLPNASRAVRAGEDRANQLRAAAYARRKGLPLVMDEDGDRELVDLSSEELIERSLETRSGIDHIVLADQDAPSSALAGRYAADNGAYLQPASGSVENHTRALELGLLRLADHNMGFNATTSMLDGTYLTLFGTPQATKTDPMEDTAVIRDDPRDGDAFPSDLPYTDINGDGRVDLNPGRMPADLEAAAAVMEGSERSDSAVVASSYRKPTWPQVLLNHGGGLWTGDRIASTLEDRGIETDLLVENRTTIRDIDMAVRGLLYRLIGTADPRNLTRAREVLSQDLEEGEIHDAFQTVLLHADLFTEELASSGAVAEQNSTRAARLRKLADVFGGALSVREMTKLLQAYLEYDIDVDREGLAEIAARLDTYNDSQELSVDVIASILDPHPELNASGLAERLPGAGKLIYTGAGNGTHWLLPNEDGTRLDFEDGPFNQYNGTNSYRPDVDGFLYDTSSKAAAGSIADRVLHDGASGMVGHTAATYTPYSGKLARGYMKTGFTRGQAARRALNDLIDGWVFDPNDLIVPNAYWRHSARLNKTRASFVQYGDPETIKDPVLPDLPDLERGCDGTECTYTWTPEAKITEIDGRPLIEGLPSSSIGNLTVPFYRMEKTFPAGTEVLAVGTERADGRRYDVGTDVSGPVPSEPVQYETHELPDGRVQLTVRRTAATYRESGLEVYPRPEVIVRVDQPERLDLDAEATADAVSIDVSGIEDGTTVIEVRNETWRDRKMVEDGNTSWSNLSEGRYLLRAVHAGEVRAGPVRETVTVGQTNQERPDVDIATPETVETGERFPITVGVQKPASTSRTVVAEFVPADGVQAAAFEPGRTDLDAGPGRYRNATVTAQAFLPGERNVTIRVGGRNITETIAVQEKPPLEDILTAFRHMISSRTLSEQFEASHSSDNRRLSVSRAGAEVVLEQSPAGTLRRLRMSDAALDVVVTDDAIERRYMTPEGRATVTVEDGTTTRETTGIPVSVRDELDAVLEREMGKLVRRYYWGRSGSTAR